MIKADYFIGCPFVCIVRLCHSGMLCRYKEAGLFFVPNISLQYNTLQYTDKKKNFDPPSSHVLLQDYQYLVQKKC
jgi:hypothetical protein